MRMDCAAACPLCFQVGQQREAKLEAQRRDQEGAGLEECTFRPQLNPCTRCALLTGMML